MFSLLDAIDKYIRENNIPLKSISINYSCFPSCINQIILNELRKIIDTGNVELGPEEYQLVYSTDGTLCLLAQDSRHHTNFVTHNNLERVELGFPYYFLSERKLIRKSCTLKKVLSTTKINKKGNKTYQDILDQNKGINELCHDNFVNMISIRQDILNEIDYEELLKQSYLKIITEIDKRYKLNKEEIDDMKDIIAKNDEPELDQINKALLNFEEPLSKPIAYSYENSYNPSMHLKRKKNFQEEDEFIPWDDRLKTIEEYPYLEKKITDSDKSHDIFASYLFKTSNNTHLILIEPFDCNKYSIMIIVESIMDSKIFDRYINYYINMPFNELVSCKNVIKIGHTTLDSMDTILKYVLSSNEEELTEPKKRIL